MSLDNNAYQDKIVKKKIEDLSSFLENVDVSRDIGKAAKRNKFDPYTRNRTKKQYSLNECLTNIQSMINEAEEDEELDDIGDIETDADVADDEDIDADVDVDTDVSDADIDNEIDPEEGNIQDGDGAEVDGIWIAPGQRYFMGASADPKMVIVGKVSEDYVWYYSFPYKKAEKLKKDVAANLFKTGSETWLKSNKSSIDEDLKSSIEAVLNGKAGEKVSVDDYQFSNIQVKYTGDVTGDLDPWKELESEYDVKVDSNLTNKQTYNLRLNNKELEAFRNQLQEKPVAERNYKIIRIVSEERDYMLEATAFPTIKATERDLEEWEKETYAHNLTSNIGAGYGAEGFVAGEKVEYNKEVWNVLDFVPMGEKMTLILINDAMNKVVDYAPINKVKKLDEVKNEKKPTDHNGKKAEGVAVDVTPKDRKIELPTSGPDGITQNQKALKEETDNESKKVGALVEFIKKDPELNKNRYMPIVKNLQRKRREGNYDSNLASKSFRVLVDEGARKFFNSNEGKILGEKFNTQQDMFTTSIKDAASKEFFKEFEANVEMGNLDQEETVDKSINKIADKSKVVKESVEKEAVVFNPSEVAEFKKFDNVNISAENVVTYSWDSGNKSSTTKITKKPRPQTNDFVYSAVTTDSNEKVDPDRTIDSKPFKTQEDLPILRDFLSSLKLNEEGENVKTQKELDAEIDEESMTVDLTGVADKKSISAKDVHPEQLIMGIKVEMEHTGDKKVAKKIALDHLAEIPDYYTRLAKMETEAKASLKNKNKKEK